MPSSGAITFNENPDGIYNSGDVLSGKVNLETDKVKAIKGVYITICGYSEVEWSEEESSTGAEGQNETDTVYFKSREEYFCSKLDILESPDGNRFDLMPGKYEFSFQIQLPTNLPSSFRGKHGEIHYEVACTIYRPWRLNNVVKQPFTILSIVNLNTNPIYRQPSDRSTIKHFSRICCCGNSGHIIVKGLIPYSGFAPGQTVPIKINVKNLSDIECYDANVKLIKMVEYRSYKPRPKSKYDTEDLACHKFGFLGNSQSKELQCQLRIPSTPPSSLTSCKIIEISYFAEIRLKTKGFHNNMHVRMPITIGTVPVFYGDTVSPYVIASQPLSLQGGVNESAMGGFIRAVPPSYEEAMQSAPTYKERNDKTVHPSNNFGSKYPVYHYSSEVVSSPDCNYSSFSQNDCMPVKLTSPDLKVKVEQPNDVI